jgi:hypothetical protein
VLGAYNAERAAQKSPQKPKRSPPSSWKLAAAAWRWQERAGAWDAAELERRRVADAAAFRDELERHRRHAVAIARVLIGIDVDALKIMADKLSEVKAEDIPIGAIPSFLRTLVAVGETALNAEAVSLGAVEILKALDADACLPLPPGPPLPPRHPPRPPTPPADRDPPAGPPAAAGLAAAVAALFDGR